MSERISPPVWYWIVAAIALIWNAMGVMAYIAQVYMTPETLAAMSEEQRIVYETSPAWVTAAFAIAVFGGTLGSLLLLLRKGIAGMIFILSLGAVIIQWSYYIFIAKYDGIFASDKIAMTIMIPLFAVLFVWLARSAKSKGWI